MRRKTSAPRFIVGIDEVGRGPLAGPVAVGAVAVTPRMLRKFQRIKESKQLSPRAREEWYRIMSGEASDEFRFAVRMVSAALIDRIGISAAIRRALTRALAALDVDPRDARVLLDGGLHAPPEYKKQQTIIHGDAKETVIAMASVAAKVKRDRYMHTKHKKYPAYGFDRHVGYGTLLHRKAIARHGLSDLHRKSFCTAFTK